MGGAPLSSIAIMSVFCLSVGLFVCLSVCLWRHLANSTKHERRPFAALCENMTSSANRKYISYCICIYGGGHMFVNPTNPHIPSANPGSIHQGRRKVVKSEEARRSEAQGAEA